MVETISFFLLSAAKSRARKTKEKTGYNGKNNDLFLRGSGQASRLAEKH